MLSDKLKEGTEVLLDNKTKDSEHYYKSVVIVEEGSLIGLAPVTDEDGDFVDFSDGETSISVIGTNDVFEDVKILPVDFHGKRIYLTYGKKEEATLNYHREFRRFPVNEGCKVNDYDAKLFDPSEQGFAVILDRQYKPGLWLELNWKGIKLFGKIMQAKDLDNGNWFYGCKIDEIPNNYTKQVKMMQIDFEYLVNSPVGGTEDKEEKKK